jgi:ribonucleoside-diphosphate reductase alpha chain
MGGSKGSESYGGLVVKRHFSRGMSPNPYKDPKMLYSPRDVVITDKDGEEIERLDGLVFPEGWSQLAANTVGTKYFRKADVPGLPGGRETDVRQMVSRVSRQISEWGQQQGYFDSKNGQNHEYEVAAGALRQQLAFNSPVWFNVGLGYFGAQEEGRTWFVGPEGKEPRKVENYYDHPQGSACFISHPGDSISSMMHVFANLSAEVFRNGSGMGSSLYQIRSAGETITGGGAASGAKEFSQVQDAVARVIKSGGKTRRAAVLQNIPVWHPDMFTMIKDKWMQEEKARVLIDAGSPGDWESHTIQDLRGQNVNYSVLCDDSFWRAVEEDGPYALRRVTDGEVSREVRARDLLTQMAFATHGCGDPGIQNFDLMNKYNTCKNFGEIWGSNPCSEYIGHNNSACNLASLNLMKFRNSDGSLDINSFKKAVDLLVTSQDILVDNVSYPSAEIAWNSHILRPLGVGFANLGAYIMSLGLSYDSDEGREFASSVTSLMSAEAFLQSTRLAEKLGSFKEFERNKESALEVMGLHRESARKIPSRNGNEGVVAAANQAWDEAIERAGKHGWLRNSQTSLLAPTGTIGFMMDCDTTGGEPDTALVKYKQLAGGGQYKIVNGTVSLALERLGYDEDTRKKIVAHIDEKDTIEGSPDLKDEHLPVFDCAFKPVNGERNIAYMGHLEMLGAIQPHVSGAISKTLNCPEDTTVEEIKEIMHQGWKLGIKSVAIYRDNSKAAAPISQGGAGKLEIIARGEREHLPPTRRGITQKIKITPEAGEGISLFLRTGEYPRGRAQLENSGYRGVLGELFIDSLERGSEVGNLLSALAIQFSEKLQAGMHLEDALEVFSRVGASQISGKTDHPYIPSARGPWTFIHDWIAANYLGNIEETRGLAIQGRELRPVPSELRIYQLVPKLHLFPTVAGSAFYDGVPTLEETVQVVSGSNFWLDSQDELDTRQTLDKIRAKRNWEDVGFEEVVHKGKKGRLTGQSCNKCGKIMIPDGKCWKCVCGNALGGCIQ